VKVFFLDENTLHCTIAVMGQMINSPTHLIRDEVFHWINTKAIERRVREINTRMSYSGGPRFKSLG
jgi:hypothetical protein